MAHATSRTRAIAHHQPDPEADGLPVDLDAERLVLGALVAGHVSFALVGRALAPADFSLEKNQRIFARMGDLGQRGERIDRITLADELRRRRELEVVDGMSYLAELDTGIPHLMNIDGYIRIVREKAALRRVIYACEATKKEALLAVDDARTLIASAHQKFDAIDSYNGGTDLEETPSAWRYEDMTSYLVEELIVERGVTLWTGESGDGKSTVALACAAAVAQGQPFLGRATIERPVVYLDRENPIAVVKDRLHRLGIPDISERLKIWGLWWEAHHPPGPDAELLVTYAQRKQPLVVFDSLIAFSNCDENSSQEIRKHMQAYRHLAAVGATILIIHHRSDKSESDYRGSSDIRAVVDAAWLLKRDDGSGAADELGRLVMKPYKTRTGPGKPLRIEYADGTFLPVDGPRRPVLDIVLDLIRARPGSTQQELIGLAQKQCVGQHKLVETLDAAVIERRVDARRGRHNTLRYHPPADPAFGATA
jgi:hypothetical protein